MPSSPNAAVTSTVPSNVNSSFPVTSTNPPFPENPPPLALISPAKLVVPSDQTITLPPSPFSIALAEIIEPLLTEVS